MANSKDILLRVFLDAENVPERIEWNAEEGMQQASSAKAFLLSIFEEGSRDTMKLDLWTKDFQMDEMDRFMYYSLRSMCETYLRATNNVELSNEFRSFVDHFGRKTEIA